MSTPRRGLVWPVGALAAALLLLVAAVATAHAWMTVAAAVLAVMAGVLWRGRRDATPDAAVSPGGVYEINEEIFSEFLASGRILVGNPHVKSAVGESWRNFEIRYLLTVKEAEGGFVRSLVLIESPAGSRLVEVEASLAAVYELSKIEDAEESRRLVRRFNDTRFFMPEPG
ncbi:hypothetical protein ACF09K_14505 [Streptomyces sp. NPDC014882]|uniref:hypothetical protein n=1 Tax=Streptomyces sp. NPDC014882 TaxID=3364927 RepID=UPI0036FF638E